MDVRCLHVAHSFYRRLSISVADNATVDIPRRATVRFTHGSSVIDGTVIVADNELGIVADPASVMVDEAGGTATYDLYISSYPLNNNVVVTPTSPDTDTATVSGAVTFPNAGSNGLNSTWWTARTVTVTGVDDDVENPMNRRTVDIAHEATGRVFVGRGGAASALPPKTVTVTVTDDDAPADTTAPTVTLARAGTPPETGTATGEFGITATFSESVTGFAADDIEVGNGTVKAGSLIDANAPTYAAIIVPSADFEGAVTIDVAADAADDAAGNGNEAATRLSVTADTLAPVEGDADGERAGLRTHDSDHGGSGPDAFDGGGDGSGDRGWRGDLCEFHHGRLHGGREHRCDDAGRRHGNLLDHGDGSDDRQL